MHISTVKEGLLVWKCRRESVSFFILAVALCFASCGGGGGSDFPMMARADGHT